MTFQKRSRDVKTNLEVKFLNRFCAGWELTITSYHRDPSKVLNRQRKSEAATGGVL